MGFRHFSSWSASFVLHWKIGVWQRWMGSSFRNFFQNFTLCESQAVGSVGVFQLVLIHSLLIMCGVILSQQSLFFHGLAIYWVLRHVRYRITLLHRCTTHTGNWAYRCCKLLTLGGMVLRSTFWSYFIHHWVTFPEYRIFINIIFQWVWCESVWILDEVVILIICLFHNSIIIWGKSRNCINSFPFMIPLYVLLTEFIFSSSVHLFKQILFLFFSSILHLLSLGPKHCHFRLIKEYNFLSLFHFCLL